MLKWASRQSFSQKEQGYWLLKRAEWQKCVDAGGSAFEGDEYDDFEGDYSNVISENYDLFEGEEYIDFDGEEEQLQSIIYSEFENNLNLDL